MADIGAITTAEIKTCQALSRSFERTTLSPPPVSLTLRVTPLTWTPPTPTGTIIKTSLGTTSRVPSS